MAERELYALLRGPRGISNVASVRETGCGRLPGLR